MEGSAVEQTVLKWPGRREQKAEPQVSSGLEPEAAADHGLSRSYLPPGSNRELKPWVISMLTPEVSVYVGEEMVFQPILRSSPV